ncbi:hypothetical protein VTP01DRAFT_3173 [Rhizomucor pusillus]|uniref:uncharacterized protein n=1 Tax=Rhizomucor pusillus TaxID=4840 RepID=UPI0037440248
MSDSEDDLPLSQRNAKIAKSDSPVKKEIVSPVKVEPASPTKPMNGVKQEDDDDEDSVPLSQRTADLKRSAKPKAESDEEDEDTPLSKRRKKAATPKKKVKKEPNGDAMDVDSVAKKRGRESSDTSSRTPKRGKKEESKKEKKEKKPKNEKTEEEVYKWWEDMQSEKDELADGSIKWTTLQHNGVLFPPEYVPHNVKMKYDGKPITLTPEAEEVATFFANILETDHAKNPTFQKNFFRDWQKVLAKDPRNPKITEFEKCDFRPIWEKLQADKEKKKQMTKEEKQRLKEEKAKREEPYLYAWVDGRKEKVGNFRLEPPELFRGRGDHPKTGSLKQRIRPEQITLNLGKEAKVPPPPPGHQWGDVIHDQTATWLASWKENVNGTIKYVFLAHTSTWKGQSDMSKFDKARELKTYVDKIRKNYMAELKNPKREIQQRATAMYLIDRLALRAGNEKGEDEADTVGCCSLRYEHIELEPDNTLHFDFLGKDSIRYQNSVKVDPQVYKNIKTFKKENGPDNKIFDKLTTTGLNKHLNSCMEGLSAKVFRTYNASHTFQQQLEKLTVKDATIPDKMLSFNRANRDVAVLCNHQRTASKSHGQQMERIQDRIRALKYQRMKLRKKLFEVDSTLKKKRADLAADESDLEEEWIIKHEENLVAKERERVKNKFAKENEKRKAENEDPLPESHLEAKLKLVDEMEQRLKKERKTGRVDPGNATAEKLLASIAKIDQRITATKIQATDKEENKEIALTTSKTNYIDPRISFAWCKKYDVPVEKVFNKTLLEKFRWASNVDANWKF